MPFSRTTCTRSILAIIQNSLYLKFFSNIKIFSAPGINSKAKWNRVKSKMKSLRFHFARASFLSLELRNFWREKNFRKRPFRNFQGIDRTPPRPDYALFEDDLHSIKHLALFSVDQGSKGSPLYYRIWRRVEKHANETDQHEAILLNKIIAL